MNSATKLNKKILRRHATKFLGYGDPEYAKLWFVGLEDVTPLNSRAELRQLPTLPYVYDATERNARPPAVYTVISKVVTQLKGDTKHNTWRTYRTEVLFKAKSDAFLVNLYPLGKRVEEEWPKIYQKWFDMTRDAYYRWLQYGNVQRFAFLRKSRIAYYEPLTICFGKNHWHHFARCFAADNEPCVLVDRFQVFQSRKLFMTEFFRSTRMSDESIIKLVDTINAMDMNPFRRNRNRRVADAHNRFHA